MMLRKVTRATAAAALLAVAAVPAARATMPAPDGSVSESVAAASAAGIFDLPTHFGAHTSANQTDWLVPVIVVGFSDSTIRIDPAALQFAVFDTLHLTPTGSLVDYYQWASGGRLHVRGEVVATVTLPHPENDYAYNANGLDVLSTPNNDWGLVHDAVMAANPLVNWNRFDRDGDGFVDMLWIVHAGLGGEVTRSHVNLWSITGRLSANWSRGGAVETDDLIPGSSAQHVRVDRFSMLPELSGLRPGALSEIGVYCHEFGHALGLPDLYDTSVLGGAANVGPGNWSLMSTGAWGGDGRTPETPVGLGAWPMLYLGWSDLVRPARDTTITLRPYSRGGSVVEFGFQGEPNPRHFLLECRDHDGFDAHLPATGMLIYQVDDVTIGSGLAGNRINIGASPGLRILEGDADADLFKGVNRGDANDPLPGALGITQLDDDTSPALREASGAVTNLSITGIQPVAGDVRATLHVLAPGWQAALTTSDPGSVAYPEFSRARRAVVTPQGVESQLFTDSRSGTLQVYLRTRTFLGNWGAPLALTASSRAATQPALTRLPGDDLAMAWIDSRSGTEQVWFRSRIAGQWTPERMLTSATAGCAAPSIAADANGRVFVTWLEFSGHLAGVRFMAFTWASPFGQAWTVSQPADNPTSPIVVANAAGRAVVLWPDLGTGNYVLQFARYTPDSGVGTRMRLNGSGPEAQPSADALLEDDGSLDVVFQQASSGDNEIHFLRRFAPGGPALARDTVLENSQNGLQNPVIARDQQGGLHICFERLATWGQQLRYRRWRLGYGWDDRSTDVTSDPDGSVSNGALLAVTTGNVSVLYSSAFGAATEPRSRRRRLDGVLYAGVPSPGPERRAAFTAGPNPLRAGQVLELAGSGVVPGARFELLDVNGRRLAARVADARGRARFGPEATLGLAPGVYFARGPGAAAARLVVLR